MEYPEGAETRPEDIASTQTDHPVGVESEEKRQGIASTGTEHPEGAEIESREEDIANTQMEHSEGAETRLEDIASTQTEHPEVESKSRPPEQSDTDLALHTKGRHDLVWQRHQKMQVMFENVLPQGYAITQRCSLDQGTFVYFMINALWLVATLALQFVGADLYIQIPSTKNEGTVIDVLPLAFMFLITFSSMLIVQFLAMLYHRLFTLLHVLSYVESSSSGQQSKRGAVGRDNKAFVNDGDDDDAQQRRLREIV
ncbi:uncharacterized protein LOC116944053 isoform X1 [Petromyzon marinus]|uniref:uncharacterized protein LOC116944053 isoform X1 n=1 Tax=Petromyzon marinus TaxID=7757 RepID=UPI003F726CB5